MSYLILLGHTSQVEFLSPVNTANRRMVSQITLTDIGEFGLMRKERPGIPAHYHTGIDIKRPTRNYFDEPIFPVKDGLVISKRTDGPYAQLIIEHQDGTGNFWTLYEHIAGVEVELYQPVAPDRPIARFMNKKELDEYGWQFDHFHFEVLKTRPLALKPDSTKPERHFSSYTLTCYTRDDLRKYFHHPMEFLKERL
ncbi:MAG: M23 family metallopeptidase [Imperialibacter sp.]|uniref:M23 family metallopeptidase n=1 Tax=Imperialibacter sp. TaxID=2038411 RepID=UPI0032ED469D